MKVSSVAASSPFKQAMLSPEECYILDNGVDKTIFVWKGAAKHFCDNTSNIVLFSSFCTNSNKEMIGKRVFTPFWSLWLRLHMWKVYLNAAGFIFGTAEQ